MNYATSHNIKILNALSRLILLSVLDIVDKSSKQKSQQNDRRKQVKVVGVGTLAEFILIYYGFWLSGSLADAMFSTVWV